MQRLLTNFIQYSTPSNFDQMDATVESFMRTEAPTIDDAFGVPSVYDEQRAIYRKVEPVE